MPKLSFLAVALMLVSQALAQPASQPAHRVDTIDAHSFEGKGVAITADKVEITVDGKLQSLPRGDVAAIRLGACGEPMAQKGQQVIRLVGNSQLAVSNLKLEKSKFVFDNTLLGHCEVALESAKAIFEPDKNTTPQAVEQRCAELKVENGSQDTLVIFKSDTEWPTVDGVLKGLDGDNVTFTWNEADRTVERKLLRAIYLANMQAKPPVIAGTVTGTDGSVVGFATLAMDEKHVTVDVAGLGSRKLSRSDVAVINFTSDRVKNLVDLKPDAVKEHGLFDTKFAHKVNKSVGGKELKLGGQVFATGLGTHSFCELTYKLDGSYKTFVAVAGIDDAVRPSGNVTLTILGDDKEIQSFKLTGKDKPQLVRVQIDGAKQLVIRVDFGDDKLDVSDHLDIVEARLIK